MRKMTSPWTRKDNQGQECDLFDNEDDRGQDWGLVYVMVTELRWNCKDQEFCKRQVDDLEQELVCLESMPAVDAQERREGVLTILNFLHNYDWDPPPLTTRAWS